jgi:hypothetical protein
MSFGFLPVDVWKMVIVQFVLSSGLVGHVRASLGCGLLPANAVPG